MYQLTIGLAWTHTKCACLDTLFVNIYLYLAKPSTSIASVFETSCLALRDPTGHWSEHVRIIGIKLSVHSSVNCPGDE